MALICCGECRSSVSDRAAACPHCGNPLAAPVQTIEQTGKSFKMVMLFGGLMMIGGCMSAMASTGPRGDNAGSVLIGVVGFILLLAGKLAAWWNHG